MADSNDELLEDGDLSESNFVVLDLDEEDALLADDDEKPTRINDNIDVGNLPSDDDYLDIDLEEDILMHDEEVVENGKSVKKPIEIDFNYNDDSDDNSGGERSRFKSERQILTTPITRNTSAIPETLDAVALRNPVKFNNKGGNRGGSKTARGGAGGSGNQWGSYRNFGRNPNIHVNPHFRPRLPIGGPLAWNGFQGPQPYPPHGPPYGGGFPPQPPPHSQWNDQGYFNPPPGHPQFNQPPMDNNYYGMQDNYYQTQQNFHHQAPPLPSQPQMGWGDNFYPGHHNYPPPHFQSSLGPPMGPPRMRPPFNAGPRPPFMKPQNKPFQGKPQFNQGNQNKIGSSSNLIRPQKREQFFTTNKVPPVKQQKFDNSANRVRSNLQEVKIVDSLPPEVVAEEEDEEMKAYRKKIEEQKKLREKILKEKEEKRLVAAQQKASGIQVTPAASVTTVTVTPVTTITIPNLPKPSNDGPPGVSDEPEFKTVRLRKADGKTIIRKLPISEIKKLKKVPSSKKITVPRPIGEASAIKKLRKVPGPITPVPTKTVPAKPAPMKPAAHSNPSSEPTSAIKKVKPVPIAIRAPLPQSYGKPSRVVAVENLSASTSQKELEVLAVQIGSVEKVELDCNKNTAIIKFLDIESAQNFVTKYQRKMVDLSMIGVKFIRE